LAPPWCWELEARSTIRLERTLRGPPGAWSELCLRYREPAGSIDPPAGGPDEASEPAPRTGGSHVADRRRRRGGSAGNAARSSDGTRLQSPAPRLCARGARRSPATD